ncbi:hypothetical protein CDD81_5409 [Ophiocordyceps australis]|uniref:Uncharacterized protein n=1 Tax=Ophiocordyceps australis TaxID=1399860 RepID=A0A2C5Y9C8_9HYPO|nr:hypothetical protein CDD81_5409 [Ophiocordyceps australis]
MKGLVILSAIAACLPTTLATVSGRDLISHLRQHTSGLCRNDGANSAERAAEKECLCKNLIEHINNNVKVNYFTLAQSYALEQSPGDEWGWAAFFVKFNKVYCEQHHDKSYATWEKQLQQQKQ